MARPDSLIPGNYYFLICYYDQKGEVPQIETWIFREQIHDENGKALWHFSEPSYPSRPEEEIAEMTLEEDQLLTMLDVRELQGALLELEDFYPTIEPVRDNQIDPSEVPHRSDFSALEKHIDQFLASKANTLTALIRYTNHGISLVKRDGGLEALFFIHWKIEPDLERRIRAIFADRNILPAQDYCAKSPRVRVLSYPLSVQHVIIFEIAAKVFTDAYEMSIKDELKFHVTQPKNR